MSPRDASTTESGDADQNGHAAARVDGVEAVSISDETRRRYLNYAMSVITSRALPDVRDGLKPVQRRILYVMYDGLRLHADAKYVKCAKIAGDTTGNYHPHGQIAIYEALVRLAQDFTYRYPLIDGWGNFGSVVGLPAAAERYTEARLRSIAEELMSELRFDTVEMRPNYDATRTEPVVLPARFPNLLVNGTQGIAVGMATSIPPHNLREVIAACIHVIHSRDATVAQVMKHLKGPDLPLGGRIISDRKDIRTAYEEGRGSFRVRGEWKYDREKRKEVSDRIVIHSVPYGVETGPLVSDIGGIVEARKLPQVLDVSDQSNAEHGLRIVLDLKPGSDADAVMAYLYKHTALEQNIGYNAMVLAPDGHGGVSPRRLNLVEILLQFVDFRFTTVKRRFEFQLRQLLRRIHILEGFEIVFNGLDKNGVDKALKIIRNSRGKADAAVKLMAAFPLDAEQTDAILELQLYRISTLEIDEILEELKEKRTEANRIKKILASDQLLWGTVETELREISDRFGDDRRTSLGSSEEVAEFDPEAYIVRENTNVVVTRDGWVKRVGRIAKVEGTRVREGDEVLAVVPGSTLDHVIVFTSEGVAYTVRIDQIPASSGYGEPLSKTCRMKDGAKIIACVTTDPRFTPEDFKVRGVDSLGPFVFAATQSGQVLRIPLGPFRTASTKAGRRFCRLRPGDAVVYVGLQNEAETVFLATRKARIAHFSLDDVPVLSGPGKGVRGMRLAPDDTVLGAALMSRPSDALRAISGSGKELVFGQTKYKVSGRGGKGVPTSQRGSFERVIPPQIELVDWTAMEGKDGKRE